MGKKTNRRHRSPNRAKQKTYPCVRPISIQTPVREDCAMLKCRAPGCKRVFTALGPKAQRTVRYNLRMHRQSAHKDK